MREIKQQSKAKIKAARVSDKEFEAELKAVPGQEPMEIEPAPADPVLDGHWAPEPVNLNLAFARLFRGVK